MFPGLPERTRQRDFEILRKPGHQIFYDSAEHCFSYNEDDFCLNWMDAPDKIDDDFPDGPVMHAGRAPGLTCLSALTGYAEASGGRSMTARAAAETLAIAVYCALKTGGERDP